MIEVKLEFYTLDEKMPDFYKHVLLVRSYDTELVYTPAIYFNGRNGAFFMPAGLDEELNIKYIKAWAYLPEEAAWSV